MTEITICQMPAFKKAYKRLHAKQKEKVNEAIRTLIKNPNIGEEKKGDLAGVFVYKFKIHNQEILLAYEWNPKSRLLLALDVHENFYRDLKKRSNPSRLRGERSGRQVRENLLHLSTEATIRGQRS